MVGELEPGTESMLGVDDNISLVGRELFTDNSEPGTTPFVLNWRTMSYHLKHDWLSAFVIGGDWVEMCWNLDSKNRPWIFSCNIETRTLYLPYATPDCMRVHCSVTSTAFPPGSGQA